MGAVGGLSQDDPGADMPVLVRSLSIHTRKRAGPVRTRSTIRRCPVVPVSSVGTVTAWARCGIVRGMWGGWVLGLADRAARAGVPCAIVLGSGTWRTGRGAVW